jgi:hypothetical protein
MADPRNSHSFVRMIFMDTVSSGHIAKLQCRTWPGPQKSTTKLWNGVFRNMCLICSRPWNGQRCGEIAVHQSRDRFEE